MFWLLFLDDTLLNEPVAQYFIVNLPGINFFIETIAIFYDRGEQGYKKHGVD
jgi:hypothetical protein